MKNQAFVSLLVCVSLWTGPQLRAQAPAVPAVPVAAPKTGAATNASGTNAPKTAEATNRVDLLRQRLRQMAATNPPAAPIATGVTANVNTNAPARPAVAAPQTPVVPAPGAPAAAPAPVVAAPAAPAAPAPTAPAPAAVAAPAPAAPASAPSVSAVQPTDDKVIPAGTIKFQAADLNQVLDVYAELVGRTILRPSSLPATPITIKTQTDLTRTEAIQALESVLSLNNVVAIPVGEKFVTIIPNSTADKEGAAFSKIAGTNLAETMQYSTHMVQLKNAKPSELVPLLQPFSKAANSLFPIDSTQILVIRDYAVNVKRMMEILEKVDVVLPQEFISEVIPIKYALASDIQQVFSTLTPGGGGGTSVGRSTARGGGLGGRAGGAARGGRAGGLGGLGGGLQPGQPGYTGQPGFNALGGAQPGQPGAAGTASAFQQRLSGIINRAASSGDIEILGTVKIIADERTNSLLIFASKADMATIKDIVSKLDVVLAQVLIETIIMDVSLDHGWSYGVSAAQSPKQFGPNVKGVGGFNNGQPFFDFLGSASTNSFPGNTIGSLPSGFSYFGKLGQSWDVAMNATAGDERIHVIQRPRIQTSHAVPASIFVGSTVPYVTSTYYGGGFGGGPSSQYQQLRVGIGLNVTPFINTEGLVVMQIDETIDEIAGSTSITGVGAVPNTSSRTLSAEVAVQDRETIILGGFIRNSEDRKKSGVPILQNIPILGNLFSQKSSAKERKELIVLMRPTVLATPQAAALAATRERENLPGIRRAEDDSREDELKRWEDYEKQKRSKRK